MIRSRLMSTNKSWLSSWFVNNYIRRCSQLCPHNVSRLFDDVSTTMKLQNAASAIVDWRQNDTINDMWDAHYGAVFNIMYMVSKHSLTVSLLSCWLIELRNFPASLSVYFLSVAFLHVASRTTISGLNDELMDVLAVLIGQSIGPRHYSSRRSSCLLYTSPSPRDS